MSSTRRNLLFGLALALIGLNILFWWLVFHSPAPTLRVSFLDVGQGDAVLIQSPTGVDMLVDGGRDRSVLRELGKRLGPLDRRIDIVVETHPDADHIGGLSPVFAQYAVDTFIDPAIESDTSPTLALADATASEKGLTTLPARRGTRIHLGAGAYADILFPDRTVEHVETNTGSVVMRVVYGETSFFLSGDAPSSIEEWLVKLDGGTLASDVMKAGHHGSRTSTSEALLAAVDPAIVVISAGAGNSYGHPHQEVLDRIQASGASIESTLGKGAVIFETDGHTLRTR